MIDVTIYGNLTKDIILDGFNQYQSLGSIANVWYSFTKINPSLSIHLEPTDIGSALVYIDRETNTRVSKPNLTMLSKYPTLRNCKWSHICYINHIKDTSFISKIKDSVISVDIAGKDDFDFGVLKYIDYTFVSEEDIVDLEKIITYAKGSVIVHSNDGSITYHKGEKQIVNKHEVLTGKVNVLGAGDFFCAAFISEMINSGMLESSLEKSHALTFNYLKNRI